MKTMAMLLLLLLNSCELFNSYKLSNNPTTAAQKICLKGSGEGRVISEYSKYPFNFDMGLEEDLWLMSVQFPLRDEAIVEVDIKNNKYLPSFEGDLLENTKSINPKVLRIILKLWSSTIYDLYQAQYNEKVLRGFKVTPKILYKKIRLKDGYEFSIKYSTVVDGSYFKWQTIEVVDLKSKEKLKIQTHVRECLKKL